jgi:hypothetical protein
MNNEIIVKIGSTMPVNVKIGASAGGRLPPYTGDYTVTPDLIDDIILPTANKSMSDNVTVERVPSYEVENPAGGITFILGS